MADNINVRNSAQRAHDSLMPAEDWERIERERQYACDDCGRLFTRFRPGMVEYGRKVHVSCPPVRDSELYTGKTRAVAESMRRDRG